MEDFPDGKDDLGPPTSRETLMSTSLFNQRSNAAAMELKAEARRLEAQGLSPREIARKLDRSECVVRGYLTRFRRSTPAVPGTSLVSVEEKAEMMASVYPDDDRRQWVRRKMQAWAKGNKR